MKICKKCNKTFSDEAIFCSECGEKLVDECKCPRCGALVEPKDKFCAQCGYNLKEGNKCPKCGAELKPGSKFCPACGEQLKENQVIDVKKKNTFKANSSNGLHPAINYTLIGFFFLTVLLALVGFFGNILSIKAFGVSEDITIKYFFGQEAEQLEELSIKYKTNEFYLLSLVSFIFHSVTYFGGIVGLGLTIGFGISKAVGSFKRKTNFPRKFFLLTLYSILPYIATTAFLFLNSTNAGVKITFGWGPKLLIAAAFLSVICYSVSYILDGKRELRPMVVKSLMCSSLLSIVLIAIFGVTKQISLKYDVVKANVSIVDIFMSSVEEYSVGAKIDSYVVIPDLYILSFLFAVATLLIALISSTSLIRATKPQLISGIVCVGAVLISSLLTGVLGATGVEKELKTTSPNSTMPVGLGSGVVFTIIFSIIALACLITALCLNKEQEE